MVASRTLLLLAAVVTHTCALPFQNFFGKRATPSYSVVNVDGSNGSNPTGSIQTVTQTITVTALPDPGAMKTLYVTVPAVTITVAASESTSWYDNGMWHTSYFTRVAATQPAPENPAPTPSAITSIVDNLSVASSTPAAASTIASIAS